MGCLENMISATKDDAISVASDGNAFRVFLHCPNCRGNLGPSIRDTVLLRTVDKYRAGIICAASWTRSRCRIAWPGIW